MKFISFFLTSTALFLPFAHAQIDLHAHLNMKPGMGWLIKGTFAEEPLAKDWSSSHSTKASSKSFTDAKGPLAQIVVISLYGHPVLSVTQVKKASMFDSKSVVDEALDLEYAEIMNWINANPERMGLARNATEAATLLAAHKTAFILSLEGAYGSLETESGFKKWIDERGVAIVTPFHLTEDHFSGVALEGGFHALNSPFEFFASALMSNLMCLKTCCKGTVGVKPDGTELIEKLITRNVWIDVAHQNELDLRSVLPTLADANLPLLVTHTQLRKFFTAERGLGDAEMDYIYKHDGIVGLIPTEFMIDQWPDPRCKSGMDTFRETVRFASKALGPQRVTLGSDINAPLNGLSPSCAPSLNPDPFTADIAKSGFYTYSQWSELAHYVAPEPLKFDEWNQKTVGHFLELWKRVRP